MYLLPYFLSCTEAYGLIRVWKRPMEVWPHKRKKLCSLPHRTMQLRSETFCFSVCKHTQIKQEAYLGKIIFSSAVRKA